MLTWPHTEKFSTGESREYPSLSKGSPSVPRVIKRISIHGAMVLAEGVVVEGKINGTFINVRLNRNTEAMLRSGAFQAIRIAQPDESVIRLPFPFSAANSSSMEKSISRAKGYEIISTTWFSDFQRDSSKRSISAAALSTKITSRSSNSVRNNNGSKEGNRVVVRMALSATYFGKRGARESNPEWKGADGIVWSQRNR